MSFDGTPVEIAPDGKAKLVVFLAHWCPHCRAEVQTPNWPAALPARPLYSPVVVLDEATEPRRYRDPEEEEERRLERREERVERREERGERREEREERHELRVERREQNIIGVVGFTLSLASLLLMVGAMILGGQAVVYQVIALMIAVPGALAGLICSLIGCRSW